MIATLHNLFSIFILSVIWVNIAIARRAIWSSANLAPTLREDFWWGADKLQEFPLDEIRPFKVDFSNVMLKDLHKRLDNFLEMNTTKPFLGQGFTRGFNGAYLREVVSYWRNSYNWTKGVEILNSIPQYETTVNGLQIRFLHIKPSKPANKTLPLLLLHGWPGSIREFYEIIPMLISPRNHSEFAFEVVAPSLPGYGFSEGASVPGLGSAEIAVVLRNLMIRLGHKRFYVQGGDWGSVIARRLAALYPQSVWGIHLNMCVTLSPQARFISSFGYIHPRLLHPKEFDGKYHAFTSSVKDLFKESAYFMHQSTKPDTLGLVLSDTPAGLAAYILEKFSTWTDSKFQYLYDGGLNRKFRLDALLDNVMIYWVTNSITTSMRLYYENIQPAEHDLNLEHSPIRVPAACARFDREIWQPERILRTMFRKLVHVSDMTEGGHFAAFELPELLADDIFVAVSKMESLYVGMDLQ